MIQFLPLLKMAGGGIAVLGRLIWKYRVAALAVSAVLYVAWLRETISSQELALQEQADQVANLTELSRQWEREFGFCEAANQDNMTTILSLEQALEDILAQERKARHRAEQIEIESERRAVEIQQLRQAFAEATRELESTDAEARDWMGDRWPDGVVRLMQQRAAEANRHLQDEDG